MDLTCTNEWTPSSGAPSPGKGLCHVLNVEKRFPTLGPRRPTASTIVLWGPVYGGWRGGAGGPGSSPSGDPGEGECLTWHPSEGGQ